MPLVYRQTFLVPDLSFSRIFGQNTAAYIVHSPPQEPNLIDDERSCSALMTAKLQIRDAAIDVVDRDSRLQMLTVSTGNGIVLGNDRILRLY
jgi:hypothetical protein